ncbi:hypothetical protein M430DRAFT_198927 [Amorphotheca resinae ATCC 22711]|uniref:Uncharacterized protein n=1 Tax=Amorphotheca resinae ATCC 22711 TaxID=857342 RepID=A0A2T3B9Z7_AMORE|nr:hypothetical protein M430DRAFT_198927 [Amorphotheca resinae ATCC 22711]PSS25152.1 hypothetical protein M430DRAFT_198927 [Amorphotheca resinae ATCC 22711]
MARMRGREPMVDHLRAGLLLGSTVSGVIASDRVHHFLPLCMGLSDERKFEHLFCAFRRHDKRFRLPTDETLCSLFLPLFYDFSLNFCPCEIPVRHRTR